MKILFFLIIGAFAASSFADDFLPGTFSTGYEESFKSATNGKMKKSFGKIDYKYPRHIRFEVVSEDNPSTFVANPRTSWLYTPPFVEGEEGQVVVQRSEDLVITKFLDSLKNGAKSNKAYSVAFDKNKLTMTFSAALKKDLQMNKVILTTKGGNAIDAKALGLFKELELFYSNGRQVKMVFLDFKAGASFAADHFEFKIPPKTKVSQGK